MDRTEELEEQVRRLTQTVAEVRGRMARLEGREPSQEVTERSDRRGFLRLGAGAVLGALGLAASKAIPAAAATGSNMVAGQANVAENATTLAGDSGNPIPIFSAAEQGTDWVQLTTGTFFGALQGLAAPSPGVAPHEGVDGWASGPLGAGVYGVSDTGYGVIGESSSGISVWASGSGRIRQDHPFAGTPTHQPNLHELVRDATGVLWINNATVLVGDQRPVWRRVNTVRVDSSDGTGAPFTPFRLVDTRSGAKPGKNSTKKFAVAGQGSGTSKIPSDAIAVIGNLTATQYSGGGFLSISPGGVAVTTSSVNFITGQMAIANSFTVGLGTLADLGKLQVHVSNNTACHYIIDITGYIQ